MTQDNITVRYCPVCHKKEVIASYNISAACGKCGLVVSASVAKADWPEQP